MPRRRNFLKSLAAMPPAVLLGADAPKGIPNVTLPAQAAKVIQEPFGELRIYFEGRTDQLRSVTAGSLRLKAGMNPHPPHEHPEEEFMVVTEGTGEILVDGKTTKVGPGHMMYCAANKSHWINNTGKTPLLFFFYKWKA